MTREKPYKMNMNDKLKKRKARKEEGLVPTAL
jgi:hypothetical protein